MKDFLVHFGFPKAASTTLQFGVLLPLEQSGTLHLNTWRKTDPNEPLTERASSRLFNGLEVDSSLLKLAPSPITVLSDESLTAPIRLRQNNFGNDLVSPLVFPTLLSSAIRNCNSGQDFSLKALVILRNQVDLLFSQFVEEFNLVKFKNIDLLRDSRGEIELVGYEVYEFARYIEILDNTFGPENISVLFFEELAASPTLFSRRLAETLRVPARKIENLLAHKPRNSKKKNSQGYFTEVDGIHVPFLTSEEEEKIRDHFFDDNLLLQKRFPEFDLQSWGYLKD